MSSELGLLRRLSSRLTAIAALAMIGALGVSACDQATSDPRTSELLVRTISVQPAAPMERAFTGTIAARVRSDLGFRVGRKVMERLVDTGQTVKAGTPLMRIDSTDYEHAITAQQSNVAAAKARLVQAAADEKRYRRLLPSGAVSASEYDAMKAAADAAQALLNAAQAELKVVQDESQYSTLVADADGTVVETLAEPGQVVTAGQIVVKIAHAGPREAAINLPETIRPAIGSMAQASLYGGNARWTARLRQLSDAADNSTRTYEARYVLDGEAATAPIGATVTVFLRNGDAGTPAAVPLGALADEGKGAGVWIFDDKTSTVAFRHVEIRELGNETAILGGGVAIGERIVALGAHLLHQGQRVRVAEDQAGLP
jgi:RND family efflux transporter MFP subunit